MNIYKLDVTERNWWSLDKDDYEQRTARRPPWYKVSDEGKPLYFAVCPACNNPTQIIGLYKLPSNITAPYAKHYGKPVPRVGIYDREAYDWCPYSDHSKKNGGTKNKRSESLLSRQILELLILHFDKIIWMLSDVTGISINEKLVIEMLHQYRKEEGWLYSQGTLMNIPWIFAYMTDYQNILFKKIKDPALLQAIIRESDDKIHAKENGFIVKNPSYENHLDIGVYYTNHSVSVAGHELTEKMDMVINIRDSGINPREIYRKTIIFNFNHFNSLINFSGWKKSPWNETLLNHAREILGKYIY